MDVNDNLMKKLETVTEEKNIRVSNLEKENKDLEDKLACVKYYEIFLNYIYIYDYLTFL